MKKQVISLLLIVLCLCATVTPNVYAAKPDTVQPFYISADSITANIRASTNNLLTCSGAVRVKSNYTADVTMELQEWSGDNWVTVKSWESSGSVSIKMSGSYFGFSDHTYRVLVTMNTYDSNGRFVESGSTSSVSIKL